MMPNRPHGLRSDATEPEYHFSAGGKRYRVWYRSGWRMDYMDGHGVSTDSTGYRGFPAAHRSEVAAAQSVAEYIYGQLCRVVWVTDYRMVDGVPS